ncbi:topoisomerase DNA-binding C4 zinc finger domain-containing protein [Lacimicrobium alkaliphilum]|nr:topoisomerase DNA-binding C4 zinc finger domain-containing protein [Lacimicrobium alkaliphilum]
MQCPRCGQALTERTAKRGQHAGKRFLGCSGFPQCRYTQELNKDVL